MGVGSFGLTAIKDFIDSEISLIAFDYNIDVGDNRDILI